MLAWLTRISSLVCTIWLQHHLSSLSLLLLLFLNSIMTTIFFFPDCSCSCPYLCLTLGNVSFGLYLWYLCIYCSQVHILLLSLDFISSFLWSIIACTGIFCCLPPNICMILRNVSLALFVLPLVWVKAWVPLCFLDIFWEVNTHLDSQLGSLFSTET